MFLFIFESLGTSELLLIGIVALIFLGPRRLPDIARKAGKIMAEFRQAANEFRETWEREVNFEEETKLLRDELESLRPENLESGFSTAAKNDSATENADAISAHRPQNTIARPAISPAVRPADPEKFRTVNAAVHGREAAQSEDGPEDDFKEKSDEAVSEPAQNPLEDKRNWL